MEAKFGAGVHLESAVVEEHHEGAVRFEPLQQVESGHVCVCHTPQVSALRKQRREGVGMTQATTRRRRPRCLAAPTNGGQVQLTSIRFSSM